MHWKATIPSQKIAVHKGDFFCCSLQDSREDREFYQAKTVKKHNNNLVMLAHIQLKLFYRLSTRDITHVRKCTRPSPSLAKPDPSAQREGLV